MGEVALQNASGQATKLGTLAERINEEHRACEAAAKATLEHAMTAGDLLLEAKAGCPYGTWQDWVDDNFDGSLRTAQVYMYLARRRAEIGEAKAQSSALSSVSDALHVLSYMKKGWVPGPPKERQAAPEPLPPEYPRPREDIWQEHERALRISYIGTLVEARAKKGDPNPPPDMDVEVSEEAWRKWYERDVEGRVEQGGTVLRYVLEALDKGLGPYWAIRPEEAGKVLAQREGALAFMENNERAFADLRTGVAWLQRVLEVAEQEQARMQNPE